MYPEKGEILGKLYQESKYWPYLKGKISFLDRAGEMAFKTKILNAAYFILLVANISFLPHYPLSLLLVKIRKYMIEERKSPCRAFILRSLKNLFLGKSYQKQENRR
jgi:hypothetical protein